ncbi:ribosome biogenesis GTPase YlqF [[Mycoplasma] gypis]|uniref:Ribosome biogenesis GTPase A n=1 Tax=[Mycoplasma] gypis TaxID=92404 RepID=A0ABZ2RNR1_9BACT|nr:ribosome biogenesis GTPase YlqF [[Mycoplasma] gypis]MBN0919287.1 ribosome biogenesis GTPase YlqF [[Mycoplasma] gypis]
MFNWFPGHMKKAFDQIKQKEKLFDVFVIVLDSRCPISSYNAEFDKISPHKKRIFVFTKIDLTNKTRFKEIIQQFNNPNDEVVALNLKDSNKSYNAMVKVINKIHKQKQAKLQKGFKVPPLKIGVMGVPNSGKSTLINILAKSKVAKVGNEAGVTRSEQWVNCNNQFLVLDTPGLLWPKLDDQSQATKLAVIGSIKKESIDLKDLCYESYKLVSQYSPEAIEKLNLQPAQSDEEVYNNLILLARNKHFLDKNKQIIFNDVYNFLVNYFKNLKNVIYD